MNRILRDNIVLIIGIFIPIIMILIFGLATLIPKWLVPGPQYDFLYTTGYNSYNQPNLIFNVSQGKINAFFICDKDKGCSVFDRENITRLFLFNAKEQKSREISIELPPAPSQQTSYKLPVNIPELNNLKIDTRKEAPDGYVFGFGNNNGFMGDVFSYSRYNQPVISKNGNNILIKTDSPSYYYNVNFIGWIVTK